MLRAGYGRYFDFGYTNANILFAAVNATGLGAGTVFEVNNANGIRNPNGTFFNVNDPIANIQAQNEAGGALPVNRHVASPRLKQPYTDQISVGWSHQLDPSTVVDVDYMHVEGRDIGWRPRLNARSPGRTRQAIGTAGHQPESGRHRDCHQRRQEPSRWVEPRPPPAHEPGRAGVGVVLHLAIAEHHRQQR